LLYNIVFVECKNDVVSVRKETNRLDTSNTERGREREREKESERDRERERGR